MRCIGAVRGLAVATVIVYGGLLRFDAVSQQYDPVAAPRWVQRLERSRQGGSIWRPSTVRWDRWPRFPHRDGPPSQYRSDPYTYLQRARHMPSFYSAHLREPVFPYTTKLFLALLHDEDTAVSFASAVYSVLIIVATLLLGRMVFSYGVGLAAALLVAIEYDLITQGTQGWRDEAFASGVLLLTCAALAWAQSPSRTRALLLGAVAGMTALVRITALSCIFPAFAYAWVISEAPVRRRTTSIALASTLMLAMTAPFLVNCWRAYGDPFYSVNAHADVYRTVAEANADPVGDVRALLTSNVRAHPVATIDTFISGETQYPFANKWGGFEQWCRGAGRALSWLALAGLVLLAVRPAGRLVLIVLLTSTIPYAFTWRLIPDWRFTEHAYPFFLIAACAAASVALRSVAHPSAVRAQMPEPRDLSVGAALLVLFLTGWLLMTRVTPRLIVKEALRSGEPATIQAGARDAAFFGSEWSGVTSAGATSTRVAHGSRASMWIPLPDAADYDALVRIDADVVPVPPEGTVRRIDILLDGRLLSTCDPGSRPDRIGVCQFPVPVWACHAGMNRLTFAADGAPGFRVWYVRVQHAPRRV